MNPWDPPLGRLRRRALAAGALGSAGRFLLPGVPLAIGYLVAARYSAWARFLAPYVGLAAGVVLLGFLVVGALRARRSRIYFAKWLDLENALHDRLASAVEWQQLPQRDSFQEQCIRQISLELAARRAPLKLPRTRPQKLPLALASLLVLGGAVVIQARQRPPSYERDAHEKVVLAKPVVQAAGAQVSTLKKQELDPDLDRLTADLAAMVQAMDDHRLDRETSLAELEELRQRAERARPAAGTLGDLAGLGDRNGGPVGALARAVAKGDASDAGQALQSVAAALKSGALSDEEAARLKPLLDTMAKLADKPLSTSLASASRSVERGDQADAARALGEAVAQIGSLEKPLARAAAVDRIEQTVASLERAAHDDQSEAISLPSSDAPPNPAAPGDPNGAGQHLATITHQAGGAGAGADVAATHDQGTPPPTGTHGDNAQLTGVWNGRILRQLFDANSGGRPSDEAKRVLVDHQRVVEDRFRHDDVPLEYQDAVRAYFAALHLK